MIILPGYNVGAYYAQINADWQRKSIIDGSPKNSLPYAYIDGYVDMELYVATNLQHLIFAESVLSCVPLLFFLAKYIKNMGLPHLVES